MTLSEFTKDQLIEELLKRENVWHRNIIPCEHYKIVLRGESVVHQSIGGSATTILVVR